MIVVGVTQVAGSTFRIIGLLLSPGSMTQDLVMGAELQVPVTLKNVGDVA